MSDLDRARRRLGQYGVKAILVGLEYLASAIAATPAAERTPVEQDTLKLIRIIQGRLEGW